MTRQSKASRFCTPEVGRLGRFVAAKNCALQLQIAAALGCHGNPRNVVPEPPTARQPRAARRVVPLWAGALLRSTLWSTTRGCCMQYWWPATGGQQLASRPQTHAAAAPPRCVATALHSILAPEPGQTPCGRPQLRLVDQTDRPRWPGHRARACCSTSFNHVAHAQGEATHASATLGTGDTRSVTCSLVPSQEGGYSGGAPSSCCSSCMSSDSELQRNGPARNLCFRFGTPFTRPSGSSRWNPASMSCLGRGPRLGAYGTRTRE